MPGSDCVFTDTRAPHSEKDKESKVLPGQLQCLKAEVNSSGKVMCP